MFDDMDEACKRYSALFDLLSPAEKAIYNEIDTDDLETDYFETHDFAAFRLEFPQADEKVYECLKAENEYFDMLDEMLDSGNYE